MESKIDIDKFICFLIENKSDAKELLEICLRDQGLIYKNGEIVEIEEISGNQEKVSPNKPQTIKFNESEDIDSVWTKEVVDELLEETQKNTPKVKEELKKYFSNVFPTIYDIDEDKMVEEYRESLNSAFLPLGYYSSQLNEFTKVYKRGLEDMLKVIRKETNNET